MTTKLTDEQIAEWEKDVTRRQRNRAEWDEVGRRNGNGRCPPSKHYAWILALIEEVRASRAPSVLGEGTDPGLKEHESRIHALLSWVAENETEESASMLEAARGSLFNLLAVARAAPGAGDAPTHWGPRFDAEFHCLRHKESGCPSCLAYALGDANAEIARLRAAGAGDAGLREALRGMLRVLRGDPGTADSEVALTAYIAKCDEAYEIGHRALSDGDDASAVTCERCGYVGGGGWLPGWDTDPAGTQPRGMKCPDCNPAAASPPGSETAPSPDAAKGGQG